MTCCQDARRGDAVAVSRKKLLSMAAVCGAALLSCGASADYAGVAVQTWAFPEIGGVQHVSYRVYLTFDDPADELWTVFGESANPLNLGTFNGSFYQDPFGGNTEPESALLPIFPDLEYDSFVTIGSAATSGGDATFQNGIDGNWGPTQLLLTNGAWFRIQGDPLTSPVTIFNGELGVLIAQLTLEGVDCVSGEVNFQGDIGGRPTAIYDAFVITGLCPTGACCFSDGTCIDTSPNGCDTAFGTYLGNFTECAFESCDGVCCLNDGLCLQVSVDNCVLAGGDFQGLGTSCVAADCPRACCVPGTTCMEVSLASCTAMGGTSSMSSCSLIDCPGACCLPDNTCVLEPPAVCVALNGISEGEGTLCRRVDCVTAACCLDTGLCQLVTMRDCDVLGGTFRSRERSCSGGVCEGACCAEGIPCAQVSVDLCNALSGVFNGLGSTCDPDPCPEQPEGACCLITGSCQLVTPTLCEAFAGHFKGVDTSCILAACPVPGTVLGEQKISNTAGGLTPTLFEGEGWGTSVARLGDVDGDGVTDAAVGAPIYDDTPPEFLGSVRIVFLNSDGTVKDEQRITEGQGGFGGDLDNFEGFGVSVAGVGDLDKDGVPDLVVGVRDDDVFGSRMGSIWVLLLNSDGTVKWEYRISHNGGDQSPALILDDHDVFGSSVALLGDLNGDGSPEIAIGAPGDDDGGAERGAVYIWSPLPPMPGDGVYSKISDTAGGFNGALDDGDGFGSAVAGIGDLNGDGVADLAVGAPFDDDFFSPPETSFGPGTNAGAVWILFLNADGTVLSETKLSAAGRGLPGNAVQPGDLFGASIAGLGDLNGDGVRDLAIGKLDDDGASLAGAVYLAFMDPSGAIRFDRKISATSGGFTGPLDAFDGFGSGVAWLGDIDGDARGDIMVGTPGDDDGDSGAGAVYVLFMDGVRSIDLTPVEFPASGAADFVAAGDLDTGTGPGVAGPDPSFGTQDAVIVVPSADPMLPGAVQIFLNQGTIAGSWLGLVPSAPIDVGFDPTGVAVGRLDGDAFLDIVVSNGEDDDLSLLLNSGDGAATMVPIADLPVDDEPRAVATGDFNGDGLIDIAVAHSGATDSIIVYLNTGETLGLVPGFSAQTPVSAGAAPWSIEPEDVDGDRCLDLIVTNFESSTVSLLLDQGSAVFLEELELSTGLNPVDTATGDLDGNGFIDIVTANSGEQTLSMFLQEDDGSFPPPQTLQVGAAPLSVTAADLDGDQDLDLAVVATDPVLGQVVQILQNLGDAVFAPPEPEPVNADPGYLVAVDLDEDGVTDLITANEDVGGATGGSVTALISSPLTCAGDANGDGQTNVDDLVGIIILWGTNNQQADINGDGVVNVDDLVEVIVLWGDCLGNVK